MPGRQASEHATRERTGSEEIASDSRQGFATLGLGQPTAQIVGGDIGQRRNGLDLFVDASVVGLSDLPLIRGLYVFVAV